MLSYADIVRGICGTRHPLAKKLYIKIDDDVVGDRRWRIGVERYGKRPSEYVVNITLPSDVTMHDLLGVRHVLGLT